MSDTQARIGLAVGGAVIGGFFGAPGLGLAIGSLAGGLLFPGPDPPPAIGPRIGDIQVQVSAYGNAIPLMFGTVRVAGNIIWNSDIREIANKRKVESGGKGGAPQQTAISFTYLVDLAVALGKGPIDGVGKVWANDEFFYDFSNPPHARGFNARIYRGTDTQDPDPTIEADKGAGLVPAHRGLAYAVIRNMDLAPFNNGVPTFHWQVIVNGDPTLPVTLIPDVPSNGASGKIAIDPDTGLIWAARGLINKVLVYQCNAGLQLVCEIDHVTPLGVSYQPAFLAVNVDILGTVTQQSVPAKMWVGSSHPDGLGGKVTGYATDGSCRILEEFEDPFGGSLFSWPGEVIVDQNSIDTLGPNIGSGPALQVALSNVGGSCTTFSLNPLSPGGGTGNLAVPTFVNHYGAAGLFNLADWVQAGNIIAGIDDRGKVFHLETERSTQTPGYKITNVRQDVIGFASLRNSVTYDPEEDAIYTCAYIASTSTGFISKYDRFLNQLWTFAFGNAGDSFLQPARIRYHEGNGDVWVVGNETGSIGVSRRINKESGGYLDRFVIGLTNVIADFRPFPGAPFAVATTFGFGGGVAKFPLRDGARESPPTLASVVTSIIEATDELTAADIDVTSLVPFTVRGFSIGSRASVRNLLQPLMTAFFFDVVESGDVLKFVRRGGSPVLTIPVGDMNARRDGDTNPGSTLEQTRTQETELPTSVDVRYINHDTDYKVGVQNARRLTVQSQQIRTADVPVVFTGEEARNVADVLLHNIWFERTSKSFNLSKQYFILEPTDIVTITTPDQGQINVRINQVGLSLPNLMSIDASEEDATIYTGNVQPGIVGLQPQPPLKAIAPVILIIMETSTLIQNDNNLGVYVVAYAAGGNYDFAEVLFSPDNGAYASAAVLPNEGNVGFTETQLTWEGSFK